MLSKELEKKVERSINLIKKGERTALRYRAEGYFVAFSGGKDSQVLLELVKMAEVKHTAEYRFTTIDPPENVRFIKEYYPDVAIIRPATTFYRLVLKHKTLPTQWMRYCCRELKESANEHAVTLTGVRRDESARRSHRQEVFLQTRRRHPEFTQGTLDQFSRYQESTVECLQGKDKLTINPILEWSEADVWQFIKERQLPINPLYQSGYTRVGCLFCPMSNIKSIRRDVEHYPKYYAAFIRLIHRMREQCIKDRGFDYYAELTDEEVFWTWASKRGIDYTRAMKQQLSIPFSE